MKKNRPYLIFFAFLLFFLFAGSNQLCAQQSDFYGTWIGKYLEPGVTSILRFIISEKYMTMEFEAIFEDKFDGDEFDDSYLERLSFNIIEWITVVNSDNSTKAEYPDGYILILSGSRPYEQDSPIELYLSRDKTKLIFPELNEDLEELMVFRRQ